MDFVIAAFAIAALGIGIKKFIDDSKKSNCGSCPGRRRGCSGACKKD